MTAEATVNSIIANAIALADSKQRSADSYAASSMYHGVLIDRFPNSAKGEGAGVAGTLFNGVTPDIVRPEFLDTDPYSTIAADWDAEAQRLSLQLSNLFSNFLTTYFPQSSAAVVAAEQWLVDTITNGSTGIPTDVEAQIWERSRNRELRDGARLQDEALSAFAARGFSLPTGALAGALLEIQQSVADKISTHGRDVAIKQAEIQIETVKFAVAQALDYRIKAINAALEYWKAYLLPHDIAAKRFTVLADQKLKFYNATVDLYKADTQLYSSMVQNRQIEIDSSMKAADNYTRATLSFENDFTQAATAAANAAASMASAALASLHTMSQLGHITTVSA